MALEPRVTSQKTATMCGPVNADMNSDPCAEISLKDFLDFLCTAYQIAEAIEGTPNDVSNKAGVDWNQLTKNPLITHLLELEEQSTTHAAAQPSPDSNGCLDNLTDDVIGLNKTIISNDKRKNFMMFQRMQSISIDCLRNVDESVGPKISMPLERRLSTGSVALENDFLLKTPIVESNQIVSPVSPQPPPQPVTVDTLIKKKIK